MHEPFVRISFTVTVTEASQLSVPVTEGAVGTAEHSTVKFAGTPNKTGDVLSSTVMTWLCDDVLPQASVTDHVLVKMYESVQLPFVRTSLKINEIVASQTSDTEGVAGEGTAEHSTVVFAGTPIMKGDWVSRIVSVALAVLKLPHSSVAVNTTVAVPTVPHVEVVKPL